jgi:tetratricopeptide (TPR) repeat protein
VAELNALIDAHPECFAPGEEERRIVAAVAAHPDDANAQLAAARLCWELARFDACLRHADAALRAGGAGADAAPASELHYLRGRALLCLHRTAPARTALARAAAGAGGDLRDAARFQLALAAIQDGRHEEALAALEAMIDREPAGATWRGAAMYYAGLCHWRLGRPDAAKERWRRHRRELPWDRLARRSAASLGLPEAEAFRNQELFETQGWW